MSLSLKLKKGVKSIEFTGLSVSLFGIGFELDLKGKSKNNERLTKIKKSDLLDILQSLYIIRNKLSEYYYCCQNDIEELSQTKSEEEFKDAMVDNYFDRTLAMYNELGKIIFSSRYFLFLPQTQRESIQDTFDYVLLQKAYATSIISEQGGIPHEETILMIKDLLDLFDNITQEINRINELVEHTEDQ